MNNQNKKGYSAAALIIGIVSLVISLIFGLFMPLVGVAVAVLAIILGILSVSSPRKKMAIAGIILGSLALVNIAVIFINFRLPFILYG